MKVEVPSGPAEDLSHAKFAPSSLSLFEKCPGFRNRKDTPGEKSDAAEKGTRIHKALEKGSLEDLPDDEEKHLAQTFQDYIDGIIAENLPRLPKPDRRELRLTMDLGGGLYTYGTCDRLFIYGDAGIQLDYKTGWLGVEDPETNAQAWSYAIGTFQKYPTLNTVDFRILVPNRDEVLQHIFKRSDLPDMKLRLNTIIRRAMAFDWVNPNINELNPQPYLCEYCLYQAKCPALAAKALTIGQKILPGLPVPESVLVAGNSPENIAHLLRLAPFMENWASQVRKDALRLNMEEGVEIPNFRRIERSSPRSVTSVIGTYDVVKDTMSIEDFLLACSSVSIPNLEDFFASKAEKNGKGKARKQLESKLREADVLVEGGSIYYLKENKAKQTK